MREGDRLFVRSVDGRDAAWFRGGLATHEGHIAAGGAEKDVTFVGVDSDRDASLDAAYRAKYGSSIRVTRITSPEARAAGLELIPGADRT